ncbi:MAG: hypothetical protein M3R04_03940, partial [bacterium]|nr:hypothetical protein [bacterium]
SREATVWMSTAQEAQAAVQKFHNQQMGGTQLHVSSNAGLIIERGHHDWELYDTLWQSGLHTINEQSVSNQTWSGGYVFLYDQTTDQRPILTVFSHLDGIPIAANSDGSYTLPVLPYRYFQELGRHQITGEQPKPGEMYHPN